jgi:Icc-related predicted phosphoesterase
MKLLAISDVHSSSSKLKLLLERESFDAVFLAGDISNGDMEDVRKILGYIRDFNENVFFVPGNMDPAPLLEIRELEGCLNLHRNKAYLRGYSIGGVGGGLISPFMTRIEFTEEELSLMLEELGKVDLLLSHTPPFDSGLDRIRSGLSVGSKSLKYYIEREAPLLCVCGHIHESRGIERIKNTLAINPGPLSRGNYAVVDLEGEEVNSRLLNL